MKKVKYNSQISSIVSTSTLPTNTFGLASNVTKSFGFLIQEKVKQVNGMITRNGGSALINTMQMVLDLMLPHRKSSYVAAVVIFVKLLHHLTVTQGLKGAVIHLKASQVLLMQSVAGNRVEDITALKRRVKRTRGSGIPRLIPRQMRSRIRLGDATMFQVGMTMFGIYRILSFPGKLSFSTIVDPGVIILPQFFSDGNAFLTQEFFPKMLEAAGIRYRQFKDKAGRALAEMSVLPKPFMISKAGIGTSIGGEGEFDKFKYASSSLLALGVSAMYWYRNPLGPKLVEYLTLIEGTALLNRMQWARDSILSAFPHAESRSTTDCIGRLATKDEPAGKIRIFAMVDAWTQWILRPIHDMVFYIIKTLPQDGTFDQPAPAEKLIAQLSNRLRNGRKVGVYSIDLSAATDRLPISLQVPIVAWLFSVLNFGFWTDKAPRLAELWKEILVGREYALEETRRSKVKPKVTVLPSGLVVKWGRATGTKEKIVHKLTYAVGQPMGALSSWALLALTHHAIVQFAAFRVAVKTGQRYHGFTAYAVLGDDVVIGSRSVALAYLQILQEIGVSAGLAKSVVSNGRIILEFAKKFGIDAKRADAIPFREALAARLSIRMAPELIRRYGLTWMQLQTFYGKGYKVKSMGDSSLFDLPRRIAVPFVAASRPGGVGGVKSGSEGLELRTVNQNRVAHANVEKEKCVNFDIPIVDLEAGTDVLRRIHETHVKVNTELMRRILEIEDLAKTGPLTPLGSELKVKEEVLADKGGVARALSIGNMVESDRPPGSGQDEVASPVGGNRGLGSQWKSDNPEFIRPEIVPQRYLNFDLGLLEMMAAEEEAERTGDAISIDMPSPTPIPRSRQVAGLADQVRAQLYYSLFLRDRQDDPLAWVKAQIEENIDRIEELEKKIALTVERAPQMRETEEVDFSETVTLFKRWSFGSAPLKAAYKPALLVRREKLRRERAREAARKLALVIGQPEERGFVLVSEDCVTQQPLRVNPDTKVHFQTPLTYFTGKVKCVPLSWFRIVLAISKGLVGGLYFSTLNFFGNLDYVPSTTGLEIENRVDGGRSLYENYIVHEDIISSSSIGEGGGVVLPLVVVIFIGGGFNKGKPPAAEIDGNLQLVDRQLVGYQGPLQGDEYLAVQTMLHDRAFLVNETIGLNSPVGMMGEHQAPGM